MGFDETFKKITRENPKTVSEEALRLLCKIAENILKEPSNTKLRTLQKTNATVSKKILPVKGALECLKLMGFQEEKSNYILPTNLPLTTLETFKTNIVEWRNLQENKTSNSMNSEDDLNNEKPEPIIKKINLPPLALTYDNPLLRRIEMYFHGVLQYEDKELQQRALKLVPLVTLEENAQKILRNIQEHVKKNKIKDPEVSIQDTLLLELLRWFKEEFFSWVDSPDCSTCGEKTVFSHMSTDSHMLVYTDRVELHRCSVCHKFTPFPRYNDLNILLETRRGRCGEWANTFTLFCRAMGWDSRFVVEEGDHVWTEVYSVTQKRWLHCDPCENACDTPLVYESGWKKKISYVIAYSAEEVQDVTWRYCTNHKEVLSRRKQCPEKELLKALLELRSKRQKDFSEARKKYLAKRILSELIEFLTEKKSSDDDHKGRSSGSACWRLARGEIQDVEDPLYVWQIKDDEIIDDNVIIRYSPSLDKYEYISGDKTIREVKTWSNGVFNCSGIFRKEETDWKMVYLCRREGEESGNISWKVELVNSSKVIDTVSLDFQHKTYESGIVNAQICSNDKVVPIKIDSETVEEFGGSRVLSITASLSGGKGDVSWQHAQLFRQSSDSEDFPFSLRITFK